MVHSNECVQWDRHMQEVSPADAKITLGPIPGELGLIMASDQSREGSGPIPHFPEIVF